MPKLQIPEMQRIKERFPQYKDTEDVTLLNSIVRRYPIYKPIADRVGGEIRDMRAAELNTPKDVSFISTGVRSQMRTAGLEKLKTAIHIQSNIDKVPQPIKGESFKSYYSRFKSGVGLEQREKEIAAGGTIPQFDDAMTAGIVLGFAAHPLQTAKMLTAFAGIEKVADMAGINEAIHNVKGATTRDVLEIAKFGVEAILAGGVTKLSQGKGKLAIERAGRGKPPEVIAAAKKLVEDQLQFDFKSSPIISKTEKAIIIPDFKSTEEAVRFGELNKDSPSILKALRDKRAELQQRAKSTVDENEAFILIQKAQFPREALEASAGKLSSKKVQGAKKKLTADDLTEQDVNNLMSGAVTPAALVADKLQKKSGKIKLPKSVEKLPFESLEKLIDKRMKAGASQKELDLLETELAKRISEESPGFEKGLEGDQVAPDVSIGEILSTLYKNTVIDKTGGMTNKDIAANVRANLIHPDLHTGFKGSDVAKLTDSEAINIAKDAFVRQSSRLANKRAKLEKITDAAKKAQRRKLIEERAKARAKKKSGTFSEDPAVKPEAQAPKAKGETAKKPIESMFEVEVESSGKIVRKKMTSKQLLALREDIKAGNIKNIKLGDVNPINSEDAGFIKIFEEMKGLKELKNKAAAYLDVEAPLKDIGKPETALQIKTYMSKVMAGQEKGLAVVSKLAEFKLSKEDHSTLAFAAEDINSLDLFSRERLNPAVEYIRGIFDSYWDTLKTRVPEKFVLPFPESRMAANDNRMKAILDLLKTKDNSIDRAGLRSEFSELKAENVWFEQSDIRFVHIPLRIWFADLFKDKTNFRNILGRKSPSIQTLVDAGYIEKNKIDIRDILGNYIRYVEQQLAMVDIVDAAKLEGLVKSHGSKGTEGWVEIPRSLTPMMQGKVAHPAFAATFENYFQSFKGGDAVNRVVGAIKMMQFYNPLVLPMYDTVQSVMAGSTSLTLPKNFLKAARDVGKRTDNYWRAYHDGLFSTPFANPFDKFVEQLKFEKQKADSSSSIFGMALEKTKEYSGNPTRIVKDLYNTSWNVAWGMDKLIRMTTYNSLVEKGMMPTNAAQLAAKFHGDYASVPPATRKQLNRFLFTPTFEIAMNKLYIDMIKSGASATGKIVAGKPIGQLESRLAKGLLYTAAVVHGKHMYLTNAVGLQAQDYSRRYVAEVESEFGPREVVTTFANPANLWLRYYHDINPDELNATWEKNIVRMAGNRITPALKIPSMLIQNKSETGQKIVVETDPPEKQWLDRAKFLLTRSVRMTEQVQALDPNTVQKERAREDLAKAIGVINSTLIQTIGFIYERDSKAERNIRALEFFEHQFTMDSNIDLEKIGIDNLDRAIKLNERRTKLFLERLDKFIEKEYGE